MNNNFVDFFVIRPSALAIRIRNMDTILYVTEANIGKIQKKGKKYVAGGKSKLAQILEAPKTLVKIIALPGFAKVLVRNIPSNTVNKKNQ